MALSPTVTPQIAGAYRAAAVSTLGAGAAAGTSSPPGAAAGRSFGEVLEQAVAGAVQQGQAADTASTRALAGQTGVTEVVLAVAKAELALQTAVAVRDRVVAAYQEVMRMPI